jgi:hypothetical protein
VCSGDYLKLALVCGASFQKDYFGTVKTAIRVFPKLKVVCNVPTKYRLWPLVATSLQPEPVVIRPVFPLRGAFGTSLPL